MSAFTLIHSDEHLVVVAKEAGVLTTPAHGEDSLVDMMKRQYWGRHPIATIHRLDRQTSGLLVFARSPAVAAHLAKQFSAHSVEREYVAVVAGKLPEERGTIRVPLFGKKAVTHFETIATGPDATTVAVRLETGRRNQIRMHFAGIGHPILGDRRIAPSFPHQELWRHERIALHARVLGFTHPRTNERLRFEVEAPPELMKS